MILTGYSDIQAIIHAINTGRLDHYLTKPFEPEALKVTIDRALDFQAVRRRNRELTAELESAAARAVAMPPSPCWTGASRATWSSSRPTASRSPSRT